MRAVAVDAGRFVPARFFPEDRGLLKWGPDYAPRMAAVYDLFGDGRTALKTNFSKYHRQYDADPGRGLLAGRAHQRKSQLVRLRAERHRQRVFGRGGCHQQRRHRAGSRDRPQPGGWNVRHPAQQHARRSRAPIQLGVHRGIPASTDAACWQSARCSIKRQIYEIPWTDRSFITTCGLHAVRRSHAGGSLARPGGGRGRRRERNDHGLQPEPGEKFGLRPGSRRP